MRQSKNAVTFPLWFTILTVLYFVSNLLIFGIATLLNPSLTFPAAGSGADFPIQFFAVRHIAFSVPLLHGLIRRNPTILRTMYTIFVIMSVLDIILLIVNSYPIPIIGDLGLPLNAIVAIGAFLVPTLLAIRHLRSYSDE